MKNNNEPLVEMNKEEGRIRCKGGCFRTENGAEKRCHAYGKHEWCENFMVKLSLGEPEYFEKE